MNEKLSTNINKAIWNTLGIVVSASIGGILVYFGNRYMLDNRSETFIAFGVMLVLSVLFLFCYFLGREYLYPKKGDIKKK